MRIDSRLLAAPLVLVLYACSPTDPDSPTLPLPMDVHSHANPKEVRVHHLDLDLRADFETKTLSGSATLRYQRKDKTSKTLVLDTHDDLSVTRVVQGRDADGEVELISFRGEPDAELGRALIINLPSAPSEDGHEWLTVQYSTSPKASAVQWLDPSQTSGGEKPYLFTQGQAILTRSWIPLQDSPGVRISYTAQIHVDPELGVVPVMSASTREDRGGGTFAFALDKPIPPYLIALAIGNLESRTISDRCAVWSEPDVVDQAQKEFEDTEKMIQACEGLYGPYAWGRYDILVLPPAFPFGGMENPCLTFATPTILAGDKSLVALIAHELAHSWSGNLVTNATWSDFWLNEGFTVYLEQRIVEEIYGPERARMETLLGLRQLGQELRKLPKRDQVLHVDLRGRNPDDGMTAIAYDKGAALLRRLEAEVGRERFDEFLRGYFKTHAFQSITTERFLVYLKTNLFDGKVPPVDLEQWIEGPGLPLDNVPIESAAFEMVDTSREAFLSQGELPDTADWATTHWLHFLEGMPDTVSPAQMTSLDAKFGLTQKDNAEVLAAWLELAILRGYASADARVEQFLTTVGRRKFLVPLYEALLADGSPDGLVRAQAIYTRARPGYHAVSRRTLDKMLKRM